MKNSRIIIHLVWLIVLLTLAIILVCSIRLSHKQDIVNILSIGGSIVSVILAIVTIFYSFYQNLSATNLNTITATTLASLNQKVDNLVIRINGNKVISNEPVHSNSLDFTRVHGIYNTNKQLDTKLFVKNVKSKLTKYAPGNNLIDYSVYNLPKPINEHFQYSTSVCLFFSGRLDDEVFELILDKSILDIAGSYSKTEYKN